MPGEFGEGNDRGPIEREDQLRNPETLRGGSDPHPRIATGVRNETWAEEDAVERAIMVSGEAMKHAAERAAIYRATGREDDRARAEAALSEAEEVSTRTLGALRDLLRSGRNSEEFMGRDLSDDFSLAEIDEGAGTDGGEEDYTGV